MSTYIFNSGQIQLQDDSVIIELPVPIVIQRYPHDSFAAGLAQAGVCSHSVVVWVIEYLQKWNSLKCEHGILRIGFNVLMWLLAEYV